MNIFSSKKKSEKISNPARVPLGRRWHPYPAPSQAVCVLQGHCCSWVWVRLHLSGSVSVPCRRKPGTGNKHDWSAREWEWVHVSVWVRVSVCVSAWMRVWVSVWVHVNACECECVWMRVCLFNRQARLYWTRRSIMMRFPWWFVIEVFPWYRPLFLYIIWHFTISYFLKTAFWVIGLRQKIGISLNIPVI